MAEFTSEDSRLLTETHGLVQRISGVLGNGSGLLKDVADLEEIAKTTKAELDDIKQSMVTREVCAHVQTMSTEALAAREAGRVKRRFRTWDVVQTALILAATLIVTAHTMGWFGGIE